MIHFAMQEVREIKRYERRHLRRWSRYGMELRLHVYVVEHGSPYSSVQVIGVHTGAWKAFRQAATWANEPKLQSACAWEWRGSEWMFRRPGWRGWYTVERRPLYSLHVGPLALIVAGCMAVLGSLFGWF